MTKKRISQVQPTAPIKLKPATTTGDLAAPGEISSAINSVTPPPPPPKTGRPLKAEAVNRVKFNTMIKAAYIKELKKSAIDQNMTTADLLELIIAEYLKR